jgi:phosphoribosylformimino-5-aminoimidazole carboxamide ribotide isomerase
MLIPSIDLMGGKIVQLIQGKRKALEFDNFDEWLTRFSKYPLVQLIDLDAAMGRGSNCALVRQFTKRLPCQLGGGIRNLDGARAALDGGARRVIVGSALFTDGELNPSFAEKLAANLRSSELVFAIDALGGFVTIHGWQKTTSITPLQMMQTLDRCCDAFLYTHVDTEGLLGGFPKDVVQPLRAATARQLIVAGGIRSQEEIHELDAIGVDAVVGMAIYKGLIPA